MKITKPVYHRLYLVLLKIFFIQIVNAQPYVWMVAGDGYLYRTNILNCTKTFIGKSSIALEDIAFCENRRLYGVATNKLYEIDTLSAKLTLLSEVLVTDDLTGLACDTQNILYLGNQKGEYLKINAESLVQDPIFKLPNGCDGDISLINDTIYVSTQEGKLIRTLNDWSRDTLVGTINTNTHVLGMTTLFYKNLFNLPEILITSEHINFNITNPKNAFSAPICANISPYCIRGLAARRDTIGAKTLNFLTTFLVPLELEMPNVFTPNADGQNDNFVPVKYKGPIANTLLEIINRWGVTIYTTTDIRKGWNGKQSGLTEAPEGIYYWVVHYTIDDGVKRGEIDYRIKNQKGYVHLIR